MVNVDMMVKVRVRWVNQRYGRMGQAGHVRSGESGYNGEGQGKTGYERVS